MAIGQCSVEACVPARQWRITPHPALRAISSPVCTLPYSILRSPLSKDLVHGRLRTRRQLPRQIFVADEARPVSCPSAIVMSR